jgi:Holliday junction resolvase RusA-like endonuclease
VKITIKPLSVNKAWKGKRFKTAEYKAYEKELLLRLPTTTTITTHNGKEDFKKNCQNHKLGLSLVFGMSKSLDIDNPIKSFIDILSKKYGFNDNKIYSLKVGKETVKKGNEFIRFEFFAVC